MFGLGGGELLIIALIALLLFGKEDLPKTVKKISKGMAEFRKATSEAQRSWYEIKEDMTRSLLVEEEVKKVSTELASLDNSETGSKEQAELTEHVTAGGVQIRAPEGAVAQSQSTQPKHLESEHQETSSHADNHSPYEERGSESETHTSSDTDVPKKET